jgi:hypothetical protein
MRRLPPIPETEARALVMAWAEAKGIPTWEEHGWIIMEMNEENPDPVLKVMADVLKGMA